MNTAQFINILATQLKLNDRLRIFLYALSSLCTTKKCTLQLFDIQRMISNLATNAEEKHVTRMQVVRLFISLEKAQHQMNCKLVHFSFDDDNEEIVYIDLLFTEQYDNVMTYAKSQIDKTKCDWVSALTLAVNYYFPFELVLEVSRRPQPTYAKTKKKLDKVSNLFFELIDLGRSEGIDIDEIERELTEIAAKINMDVALMLAELKKWDAEQREILKKEQQKQNTQQINFHNTSSKFTEISNNYSQQTVKECADELKQQYQNRPASRWYNLANNRIEVKDNNTRNNKQLNRNNIKNNNVNNIDHSNSIKTNNSVTNSHHVSHYT